MSGWYVGDDDTADPSGAPGLRAKFQGLQSLLGENSRLLEVMADLEADLRFLPAGTASLEVYLEALLDGTLLMIEDLNRLSGQQFRALYRAFDGIERRLRTHRVAQRSQQGAPMVLSLADITMDRVAEVGAKAARLAELRRLLPGHAPDGFVVTASAYQAWLAKPALAREMRTLLDGLEVSSRERIRSRAAHLREVLVSTPLPAAIEQAIADVARQRWASVGAWAVRSSAVGEDGEQSFAGQFESVLNVAPADLATAYRRVVASRFSDRALHYRLAAGLVDAQTPMAALVIPLVEARSAGVLYTRDPTAPGLDQMLLSSTWGFAGGLVAGDAPADLFHLDRRDPKRVVHYVIAAKRDRLVTGATSQLTRCANDSAAADAPSVSPDEMSTLADLGLRCERHFGGPQDIEWAIDARGAVRLLQTRPLRLVDGDAGSSTTACRPLLTGGVTIFPGRAVAPALVATMTERLAPPDAGVILVVPQATPDVAALLPVLAGFVAEHGHPTSHAATLLREFAVPSLFEVTAATRQVTSGDVIAIDATARQLFAGDPWPGVRERTRARLVRPRANRIRSALHDLVIALNLTDPMSSKFKPQGCQSIHDLIRFIHEKAVATFFDVGDRETRTRAGGTRQLETPVPLNIHVLDIGGATAALDARQKKVRPEQISSTPFRALWRGMSHPQISWTGRREISVAGFASVITTSLGQEAGSLRRLGDANYLLVASDYLNLNIKLAYHYAMIDALVGPAVENNYVNFRFRGGGASPERRDLRARFLTDVLRHCGFCVDCRGDLVTAWLRRCPQQTSEVGLELVGKLTVCARQLDMLMDDEAAVRRYVECFLAGDYQAFA